MSRLLPALLLVSFLPACAVSPGMPTFRSPSASPSPATPASFSFDWHLSGNRAVAPLQVFDDGRRTWLQFNHGQPIPAIFERSSAGDRPLHYSREGAYLVLPGVWPELVLRGGHLQSYVRRKHAVSATAQAAPESVVPPASGHVSLQARASGQSLPVEPRDAAQTPHRGPASNHASEITAASFPLPQETSTQAYSVDPSDTNLRLALTRWARRAGWIFAPEHWAVDVDIPLTASAVFEPDFKASVQSLIAATELADRPLQPCFYSNKVLRIVPYAQACDRNARLASAS